MNLIEQLGGYEKANRKLLKMDKILKEVYYSHSDAQKANELRQALLEYRRQHKFYEVGDKVFCEHFEMDEVKNILTVEIVRDHYLQLSDGVSCTANLVRHATDTEIKAGKRL